MRMKLILTLGLIVAIFTVEAQNKWGYLLDIGGTNDVKIADFVEISDGAVVVVGQYSGEYMGNTTIGDFDIFVSKFSAEGIHLWTNSFGSSNREKFPALTIDSENNIYVAASFTGECFFPDNSSITSDNNSQDVFLSKLDSDGNLLWKTNIIHGNNKEQLGAMICDEFDNLLMTGFFNTEAIIDTSEAVINGDINDPFLIRIDKNTSVKWANSYSADQAITRILNLLYYEGDYYVNGRFNGSLTTDLGTISSNTPSSTDIFLYKINSEGIGQWLRRSYGDNVDTPGNIEGDPYGNVYFTGYYISSSMSIDSITGTVSSKSMVNQGNWDLFMAKYNKAGNLQWIEGYGGINREYALGLTYSDNLLYMTGIFKDSIALGKDTLETLIAGDQDILVSSINTSGQIIGSFSLGNETGNEVGISVKKRKSNNSILLAGMYPSDYIDIGPTQLTNTTPGSFDSFVAEVTPPFTATYTKEKHITCPGGSDGELIVTPYFGEAPYTFEWSHDAGLTDSTATNLPAGTYTVTITDGNAETAIGKVTLTQPDPVYFSPAVTQVTSCSYSEQGAINLNVTGGTQPYAYFWEATDGGYGVEFTAEDQSGLRKGTYNVTLTDDRGCTADTSIIITGPEPVIFKNSVVTAYNSSTEKGAIDLQLTGGTGTPSNYAATWSGPSGFTASTQDITELEPGDYTVQVTDQNSCVFDTTFTVVNNDIFYAYITQSKDACFGTTDGTATVGYHLPEGASTNNVTYLWDDPGVQTTQKAIGLAGGQTYTVTVTDNDNSWTATASITVDQLGYQFAGSLTGNSSVTCNGDADGYIDLVIDTEGTLPYSYNWSNGATTEDLSNLGPGQYKVTVTDANQCQFSTPTYEIGEPDALVVSTEVNKEILCYGGLTGEAQVNAAGGNGTVYTYQWNDPANQTTKKATGLEGGVYNVTVSDTKGCEAIGAVTLDEPTPLSVAAIIQDVDCNNGNNGGIGITLSGGTPSYGVTWSTSDGSGLDPLSQNQTGLTPGTYTLNVQDANGCLADSAFVLANPDPITITLTNVTDVTCGDEGAIDITVTGGSVSAGYSYSWNTSDGSGLIATDEDQTGLSKGTYQLTVTDDNGCTGEQEVVIGGPDPIDITLVNKQDVSCSGKSDGVLNLDITGGTVAGDYVVSWESTTGKGLIKTSIDQTSLSGGTYNLTVTDDNGCTAIESFEILEPEPLSVNSLEVDNETVEGAKDGNITVTAIGGTSPYSYELSGGVLSSQVSNTTGIFTDLSPATYTLTLDDSRGCGPVIQEVTVAEGNKTAIIDPDAITPLKVFPNPAKDQLNIAYTANEAGKDAYLYIFDATGKKYFSTHLFALSTSPVTMQVDLSNYPAGLYLVKLVEGEKTYTTRLVIE